MNIINRLLAILFAVFAMQTTWAQEDISSVLKNPDLMSLDGWTYGVNGYNYTGYQTNGAVPVIEFYNAWSANAAGTPIGNTKNFQLTQKVTLPAGEYRIVVNAFYREGNGNGTNTKAYIFAGEKQQYIYGLTSAGVAQYAGSNDLYRAATAFSQGDFANAFDFSLDTEQEIELGFKGYIDTYCSWCILGPVKLYKYSLDLYVAEYEALLATATSLCSKPLPDDVRGNLEAKMVDKSTLTSTAKCTSAINDLRTAISAAETWIGNYEKAKQPLVKALERFEADYNDGANGPLKKIASSKWNTIIDKVKAAATAKDVVGSYSGFAAPANELVAALDAADSDIEKFDLLKKEIGYANEYVIVNSANKSDYDEAIAAAQSIYDNGNIDGVDNAIAAMQNFKVLDYEYVVANYNSEYAIGTAWQGTTNTNKSEHWDGNANTTYFDFSRWTGNAGVKEFYQEVTLPAGKYVLKASGRCSTTDGTNCFIKVDDMIAYFNVKGGSGYGIDKSGKANFSATGNYANTSGRGWEWRFIEFELAEEKTVKIGGGYTITDTYSPLSWAGVTTPVLLKSDMNGAYSQLETALAEYEPIWNLNVEYETTIYPSYQSKLENREYESTQQIIADIEALKAAYDKYIYDNASDERSLTYTGLIADAACDKNDGWPGSGRTTNTGEHWSGDASRVYFIQNHENEAARKQTITLPYKGLYLLKVAVRAAASGAYAEIIVNGKSYKTTDIHGRTGGTIATDGTEWSSIEEGIAAGKTFANNGAGYGWVYQNIYVMAETANAECAISINLSNKDQGREGNCGGMQLYYVGKNISVEEDGVIKHYGYYENGFALTQGVHDFTEAEASGVALDVSANPNILIVANDGQVSNTDNVIIDGETESFVLNEGFSFKTMSDFYAASASYNREFAKDTWLSVCLPFDYDVPENVTVETLLEVDFDNQIFFFGRVDKMEANRPYIIKNGTETAAVFMSMEGVTVVETPECMAVEVYSSTANNDDVTNDLASIVLYGDLENLKNNLYLPTVGKNGSVIEWTSSHPEYLSNVGEILKQNSGSKQKIELTATVTKGKSIATRTYDISISEKEEYVGYLFAYFNGNSQSQEQICFALSDDGFNYTPLNNGAPIISSDTIALKKAVRDPHILRGEDGYYYMVVTDMRSSDGWSSNDGLVLLRSSNMTDWTATAIDFPTRWPERFDATTLTQVWAPQTIFDPETGKYMVYYAIGESGKNYITYYSYANEDFTDLTEPQVLYNHGGNNTIDADIVYHNGLYHMFFKTEGQGNGIQKATAKTLRGEWTPEYRYLQQTSVAVEGSGVFKLIDSDEWVLMYDCYSNGYYEYCTSSDLSTFEYKCRSANTSTFTPRHGTTIPITAAERQRLIEKWPSTGLAVEQEAKARDIADASISRNVVRTADEAEESSVMNVSEGNVEEKAEFIGTYVQKSSEDLMEITDGVAKYDILFFGNDGELYYLSQGVTTKKVNFKPFRAYIRVPKGVIDWDANVAKAKVRHDDVLNSIDSIIENSGEEIRVYDLMGRRINPEMMSKGRIYIVNGKKVYYDVK